MDGVMRDEEIPRVPSDHVEDLTTVVKKAAFKVGISTSTFASAGIFNYPPLLHHQNPTYEILAKAYIVTMFMCLSVGLILLVISVVIPMAPNSISIAKKLMWVALALVQIALTLGTSMVLMVG